MAEPAIHVRDTGRLPEPCWTVEEAAAVLSRGGLPIDARSLRQIITALHRNSGGRRWKPAGTRSSYREQGGRPPPVYPAGDLQRLHADLARWLVRLPELGAGGSCGRRHWR